MRSRLGLVSSILEACRAYTRGHLATLRVLSTTNLDEGKGLKL